MKRFLSIALLISLLSGCSMFPSHFRIHKTEEGRVVRLTYIPEGHGTESGLGFDSDGNVYPTISSVHIPARWGIVFECQHGSFSVSNCSEDQFNILRENDEVIIVYDEIFQVADNETTFYAYDFLHAYPKAKEDDWK